MQGLHHPETPFLTLKGIYGFEGLPALGRVTQGPQRFLRIFYLRTYFQPMSQARNNHIATIISGVFFLLIAGVLGYVTFSLRSEAQGREINVTLADLYAGTPTYGDYITIKDTGVVISAASDIVDQDGMPLGRAFILNGMPHYVFLVGTSEQFTDTTGQQAIGLQPGTLIPVAFKARINTQSDAVPFGLEKFAMTNGQTVYSVETGVTKMDTAVPFYITLVLSVLALIFSIASWRGLAKKKQSK